MLCYDSNTINILLQTYHGSEFLFVPIKLIPIFSSFKQRKMFYCSLKEGEDRIAFICSKSDKRYWRLIVFFAKSMKYIMMPFAYPFSKDAFLVNYQSPFLIKFMLERVKDFRKFMVWTLDNICMIFMNLANETQTQKCTSASKLIISNIAPLLF